MNKIFAEVQYRDAIKEHFDEIVALYKQFESEKRIMLYDVVDQEILPFPYEKFKLALMTKESQVLLEEEYHRALKDKRILIVINDSICQKIKSCSIDKVSPYKAGMVQFRVIY